MVRINGPVALAAALALVGLAFPGPGRGQEPAGLAAPYGLADRNGPLLYDDPVLVPPEAPPPWFAALGVEIVGPAIKQAVQGNVPLGEEPFTVFVPRTELNWTGAPRLEVGYRFGAAVGELLLNYRPLATEGTREILAPDGQGPGRLRSRLDFQLIMLDYASREFSLGPLWDMKAFVGLCLPSIFFDNEARGASSALRTSNYYFGAGPHLGMEFWRPSPFCAGLKIYGRIDGVITVGKNHQEYLAVLSGPEGDIQGAVESLRKVRESPAIRTAVGLSYTPPWPGRRLRFDLGYALERWWYVGQTSVDGEPASRGEVTVQGLFLRGEWAY